MRNTIQEIFKQYPVRRAERPARNWTSDDPVYKLLSKELPEKIQNVFPEDTYKINGQPGELNRSPRKIPYLAIYDKGITTSSKQGVYIVYLWDETYNNLYLTLNQGVSEVQNDPRGAEQILSENVSLIRENINPPANSTTDPIKLNASTKNGELYEKGCIFSIKYDKNDLPDDKTLKFHLECFKEVYKEYSEKRASFTPVTDKWNIQKKHNPEEIHAALLDELNELLLEKKQIVLTGAPGTGKTYLAKELAAKVLKYENVDGMLTKVKENQEPRFQFRQFHPGYDYSDFVEGIKPLINDDGTTYFERRPGTFMTFCEEASKAIKDDIDRAENIIRDAKSEAEKKPAHELMNKACSEHPYVMVIDEINRADLSRVFGELFYGLEKDYRGEIIPTQYDYLSDNDGFSIPPNVYIIGTMNDIDRSVESMDFALRRRFAWREITVEDSLCILNEISDPDLRQQAQEVLLAVNEKIINEMLGLDPAYYLGAAYFRDLEEYPEDEEWEHVWKHNVSVILTEYRRASRRHDVSMDRLHDKFFEIVKASRIQTQDETMPSDDVRRCDHWIISSGEDAKYWDICKRENIIVMGFDEEVPDIDLSSIDTKKELKAKMEQLSPERNKTSLDSKVRMLWDFSHNLPERTIVFARKNLSSFIGMGRVTGKYKYNKTQKPGCRHTIPVEWE
ncbi:MAG: MrcB family domain-containing protein, partial [Lentisphaeria bacterium]